MISLERLRLAIEWRRLREPDPPAPFYVKTHKKFRVFPIRVTNSLCIKYPNMQQIPRHKK